MKKKRNPFSDLRSHKSWENRKLLLLVLFCFLEFICFGLRRIKGVNHSCWHQAGPVFCSLVTFRSVNEKCPI